MEKAAADVVSEFIRLNCERSKAIILVGSHAFGEAHNDSDVDLIVITDDVESAREVKNNVATLQSVSSNNSIDCKVYTQKGFAAAKSGKEHLFLWIALRNSSLLCGEDIREDIRLNPMLITELIWQLIKELDSSCDLLKVESHFTGCCYSIYYSLLTAYFLERFVLQTDESYQPKAEFMRERLLNTYDTIIERYEWTVRHVPNPEISCQIRIPVSIDKRFSGTRYVEVLNICENTLEYLENVYARVTKWGEQLV